MNEPTGVFLKNDPAMACARQTFTPARLEMIRAAEEGHFWFEPRARLLAETLRRHVAVPATILDVGCGTGSWLRKLRESGYRCAGVDVWPEPPPGISDTEYRIGTAESLPLQDEGYDAVTLLDTLEHVDDSGSLRESWRVLRPAGIILVSVPAFPGLWSERDRKAGHRRRYTRAALAEIIQATGFEMREMFGYQMALLPLVWWNRRRQCNPSAQLTREEFPSPRINRVLRAINRAEVALGRWLKPPVGSSLILVARKPAI